MDLQILIAQWTGALPPGFFPPTILPQDLPRCCQREPAKSCQRCLGTGQDAKDAATPDNRVHRWPPRDPSSVPDFPPAHRARPRDLPSLPCCPPAPRRTAELRPVLGRLPVERRHRAPATTVHPPANGQPERGTIRPRRQPSHAGKSQRPAQSAAAAASTSTCRSRSRWCNTALSLPFTMAYSRFDRVRESQRSPPRAFPMW